MSAMLVNTYFIQLSNTSNPKQSNICCSLQCYRSSTAGGPNFSSFATKIQTELSTLLSAFLIKFSNYARKLLFYFNIFRTRQAVLWIRHASSRQQNNKQEICSYWMSEPEQRLNETLAALFNECCVCLIEPLTGTDEGYLNFNHGLVITWKKNT